MYIAAVLVRGLIGTDKGIREALKRLNLSRKNHLVLLEDNPSNKGMLHKAESYITFGPISDETAKELVEKRGEELKELQPRKPSQKIKVNQNFREYFGKKVKPVFRMQPPKGGFERAGIKKPYVDGGALGYRAKGMDELIKKMLH